MIIVMPQVSNRKIDVSIEQDLLDSLSYVLKELKTKKEVDEFLSSTLSNKERIMIAKRVMTAYLLKNNVQELDIGDTLKLTQATITRLKMQIKLKNEGYNLVFSKLDKKSKEAVVKQIFYKILNYSLNAALGRIPTKI